jgi:hypothetical protein
LLGKFIPLGHFPPSALAFEDHFAHFPNRPPASGTLRHIIGDTRGFRAGIGDGYPETDPLEKRYIHHIITDIGCLFRSKFSPL